MRLVFGHPCCLPGSPLSIVLLIPFLLGIAVVNSYVTAVWAIRHLDMPVCANNRFSIRLAVLDRHAIVKTLSHTFSKSTPT